MQANIVYKNTLKIKWYILQPENDGENNLHRLCFSSKAQMQRDKLSFFSFIIRETEDPHFCGIWKFIECSKTFYSINWEGCYSYNSSHSFMTVLMIKSTIKYTIFSGIKVKFFRPKFQRQLWRTKNSRWIATGFGKTVGS